MIHYPDGFDDFGVPSLPEQTPLSSGGDATRNHTELLEDLGDAVEVIERNVTLTTHDHSGDANPETGIQHGPKLDQANTHQNADTDSALTALHHTLGAGANQAAAGNHNHDYNALLNTPWIRCTSTTRPGFPYPGLMIYETDTDRVRVWGTFLANQISAGLDSTENFDQGTNNQNMGPTLWEQWYSQGDTTHGRMAIPNGQDLSWIDQSGFNNRGIARRINPADAVTETDDQVIIWKTGTSVIEWDSIPFDNIIGRASNDAYFRMSTDRQSYWRVAVSYDRVYCYYTVNGPANEVRIGEQTLNTDIANTEWRGELKDRVLTLYRFGQVVATFRDSASVTSKGIAYRGWGIGMCAGQRGFGQTTPANVQYVRIMDLDYYSSIYRWTVLPIANVPNLRLRQSANQKIINTGSLIEWGEEVEDQFNFFDKNLSKTDIIMKEPGLYQIDAAVQWNPSVVPDTAHVVFCINGIETTVRAQQFMRGQGFNPGFSQTLAVSGKLRFGANDILSLKAKFVSSGNIIDNIFTWFDNGSKVNSRLDMIYLAP